MRVTLLLGYGCPMASWDDVRHIAAALPETEEGTRHATMAWSVRGKTFAWERPLRKADLADLAALGEAAPSGDILGARTADAGVKDALIADDPSVYFTTPHFEGYPAVLVRLAEITAGELTELMTEGWLVQAPKKLAATFLADQEGNR